VYAHRKLRFFSSKKAATVAPAPPSDADDAMPPSPVAIVAPLPPAPTSEAPDASAPAADPSPDVEVVDTAEAAKAAEVVDTAEAAEAAEAVGELPSLRMQVVVDERGSIVVSPISFEADTEPSPPPPLWSERSLASAAGTRAAAAGHVGALTTAADDGARLEAVSALLAAAEDSYGAEAAALGEALREGGGVGVLAACLSSPSAELVQTTLSLLGNALTDVFDVDARTTLQVFTAAGGLQPLVAATGAPHPLNIVAAATLQNVTSLDPHECCVALRAIGCAPALRTLMDTAEAAGDVTLKSYATGALANLRAFDPDAAADEELEEALKLRRLASIVEQMRSGRAVDAVQAAASRWVALRRRRADERAAAVGGGGGVGGEDNKDSGDGVGDGKGDDVEQMSVKDVN
jgi:hypothetical protein